MERDIHVTLVLEVEKHECLYNSTLPDYARKEVTDEAWLEISKAIQLPVSECKDKWRNIRSTFRRSFKPSKNAKPKRTYYLSRYLNFIVPFSKPMDDSIFREEASGAEETEEREKEDLSIAIKDEDNRISFHEDEDSPSQTTWDDAQNEHEFPKESHEKLTPQAEISTPCRRLSSETEFSMPEHLRAKSEQKYCSPDQSEKDHMKYFFLSLLPEFKNMSEKQMRTFKIKVLQLIDDIKTERPVSRHRLYLDANKH